MSYDPYITEMQVREAKKVSTEGGKIIIQPSPEVLKWLELKFGMFIHFGINTFNDCEWSDGKLDPKTFAPSHFDPSQWMRAAKTAGMKYVLLVTKHVDGFCMWQSEYSNYTVASSPFSGDALGTIVTAARKEGLKVALYYCLWDCNYPGYAVDRSYALYVKRHLSELLTRYGDIVELWFDGGWEKGGVDWFDMDRWHWRELYEHVKSLQPSCLVGVNGTSGRSGQIAMWPCDFRIGEKKIPREDDKKVYYCGGIGDWLPYEACHVLSMGTGEGMFAHGKWFWHANDTKARPAAEIVDMVSTTNSRGGNFVLNASPTNEGLLRQVDIERLKEIGDMLSTGQ